MVSVPSHTYVNPHVYYVQPGVCVDPNISPLQVLPGNNYISAAGGFGKGGKDDTYDTGEYICDAVVFRGVSDASEPVYGFDERAHYLFPSYKAPGSVSAVYTNYFSKPARLKENMASNFFGPDIKRIAENG